MTNEFRVRDLGTAAFLLASKIKFIRMDEDVDEKKANYYAFIFEDPLSCDVLAKSYQNESAMIIAKHYYLQLKHLKQLIYEARHKNT